MKIFNQHVQFWLKKNGVPSSMVNIIEEFSGQNLSVLDLGCGGGRLAKALKPAFGRVCGLDRSDVLLEHARAENPDIEFVLGDYQEENVWDQLGTFDLIVSNCAIRKDYCRDLSFLAYQCRKHLAVGGNVLHRVQVLDDLSSILPLRIRKKLFFSEDEVLDTFGAAEDSFLDSFRQRFSSEAYLRECLVKIGINYDGPINNLNPFRYYTVAISDRCKL